MLCACEPDYESCACVCVCVSLQLIRATVHGQDGQLLHATYRISKRSV